MRIGPNECLVFGSDVAARRLFGNRIDIERPSINTERSDTEESHIATFNVSSTDSSSDNSSTSGSDNDSVGGEEPEEPSPAYSPLSEPSPNVDGSEGSNRSSNDNSIEVGNRTDGLPSDGQIVGFGKLSIAAGN